MASPNIIDGMKTAIMEKKKKKVLKREAAEKLLNSAKKEEPKIEKKVRSVGEKRQALYGKDK